MPLHLELTWKANTGAEESAPLTLGTATSATYTCTTTTTRPVHTPDVAWNRNTIHTYGRRNTEHHR